MRNELHVAAAKGKKKGKKKKKGSALQKFQLSLEAILQHLLL